MTTQPHQPAASGPQDADTQLAALAATSSTVLEGFVAAGMLDVVGQPAKLPTLMWPDADQALVQDIWNRALAVGYRAGRFAGSPRWDAAALNRLRAALTDAGFDAMARAVDVTMATAPSQHPADRETPAAQDGSGPQARGPHP